MDKFERKLVDAVTLSSIVIALASIGNLGVTVMGSFRDWVLLPDIAIRIILTLIVWTCLFFVIKSIYLYYSVRHE